MYTNNSILLSALFLSACGNTQTAPINIVNEIMNDITIEDDCCGCDDPCAEDSPCDDGDDTGEPGDTGEPVDEYVDFKEATEASLDLEVNQVDVAFLLDTTSSMTGTANAMADEFGDIVTDLNGTIADGGYGFATYDDYVYGGMGSSADRPFILRQQMSTDDALVQSALDAIVMHSGADWAESGMEALYQGLTGIGYDQNADSVYDASTDVLPFYADIDDVFSGSEAGTYNSVVPGSGVNGGYGFRDGSLPVIVYATDAPLRDPDAGFSVPPTASYTAGATDVADAANDIGARLIGVATGSGAASAQMTDLATATNSMYEADSDGLIDDPLVFTWTGSSATFRDTVVDAIEGMLDNVTFTEVTAEVVGNTYGFDTDVTPASYSNVTVGSAPVSLNFGVDISGTVPASAVDQTFPMTLEIYGDGSTLLGTQDVTVVVPATL